MFDVVPDEYAELTQAFSGKDLINQERTNFGITHEEIGLKSANAWSLAEEVKVAVGYHHRPDEAPAHCPFAAVIHVADILERLEVVDPEGEPEVDLPTDVMDQIGLDIDSLPKIQSAARELAVAAQNACA